MLLSLLPLHFSGCAGTPAAPAPVALCNGKDLAGWHADVPAKDADARKKSKLPPDHPGGTEPSS